MGRRPIGAVAMTDAERKRRQRHVLHPSAPKPTPEAIIRDLQASLDAMDRRLANRDAHIRELEARPVAPAPKPAKAPKEAKAPTDWADDPRTKAKNTTIDSLNTKLRILTADYEAEKTRMAAEFENKLRDATFPKAAWRNVMRCLAKRPPGLPPDYVALLDAALLGMNDWADSKKRAPAE